LNMNLQQYTTRLCCVIADIQALEAVGWDGEGGSHFP